MVAVGIGTAGSVVMIGGTGAKLLGPGSALGDCVGDWAGDGVDDRGAELTSPAVAAVVGVFGLPLVTTAAIADPPQHSTRNVPTIPSINGNLDRFADGGDGGIAYMPERGS